MLHFQKYSVSMDHEIFVPVKISNLSNYMVSNYGRVINSKTKHEMKQQLTKDSHCYVQLTKCNEHNKTHHVLVHRLVAYSSIG